MKETLIKLATGFVAKLLRYALTAAGATSLTHDPQIEQTASGIAAILIAIGWSVWEDRVKAKANKSKSE